MKKLTIVTTMLAILFFAGFWQLSQRFHPILEFFVGEENKQTTIKEKTLTTDVSFSGRADGLRRIHIFLKPNKVLAKIDKATVSLLEQKNNDGRVLLAKTSKENEIGKMVIDFPPLPLSKDKDFIVRIEQDLAEPVSPSISLNVFYQLPETYWTVLVNSLRQKILADQSFFLFWGFLLIVNTTFLVLKFR